MKVSKALKIWLDYHRTDSKKNTYRSYSVVMGNFCEAYGDKQLSELTVETIPDFLNRLAEGCKPQTKRIRYGHLAAFFNFIKNNILEDFINPCDSKMLRKLHRPKVTIQWDIMEKETVDEIIFRTTNGLKIFMPEKIRMHSPVRVHPSECCNYKLISKQFSKMIYSTTFTISVPLYVRFLCRYHGRISAMDVNFRFL